MRFDVREKLSGLLFMILLSIALPWHLNFAAVCLLLVTHRFVTGLRPLSSQASRRFWAVLRYFSIALLVMALVNGFFIREGEQWTLFRGVIMWSGGLEFGVQTGSRLLLLATSILLFFASTSISRIAEFLQDAGLPVQLVMTLLLTLSFLERLPHNIAMIFTAQEARGAAVRSNAFLRARAFFLILSPLLLSSIVESIDRSMALELRGFHRGSKLSFGDRSTSMKNRSPISFGLLTLSFLTFAWIIFQWVMK